MANRFTVINKDAMVLIAYDNGATKTYPKNAYSLQFDPQQPSEDSEAIYITGVGSPTRELLTRKTFTCRAMIDEVAGTTPTVGGTLNDLYLQLLPFFFRELGDSKTFNFGTLEDGATIAADCDSYTTFAWDLTTVETAINPITFTNIGKVVDIAIYKPNAANTVVTLAATGYIFHFFDADNDCYSLGTNCTLSGAAGTSYSLNMVVTGITPAGSIIIQVTGSYASFL